MGEVRFGSGTPRRREKVDLAQLGRLVQPGLGYSAPPTHPGCTREIGRESFGTRSGILAFSAGLALSDVGTVHKNTHTHTHGGGLSHTGHTQG